MTSTRKCIGLFAFLLCPALSGCLFRFDREGVAGGGAAGASGASAADDGGAPAADEETSFQAGSVTFTKACATTAADLCDSRCDECWSTCREAAMASGSLLCTDVCTGVCDCSSEDPDLCTEWDYFIDLGPADPGLEEACVDLVTVFLTVCGVDLEQAQCEVFARAEGPEYASLYTCTADAVRAGNCEHPYAGCTAAARNDGTRLCAQAIERCSTCPLDAEGVNEEAGWLRDDVRQAAWKCLELEACADVRGCLETWQSAVLGDFDGSDHPKETDATISLGGTGPLGGVGGSASATGGTIGATQISVPSTVAVLCAEVGAAYCESTLRCYPGTQTPSECLDVFRSGCCEDDATCAYAADIRDAAAYDRCLEDIRVLSCTEVELATVPASCDEV